MKYYSEKTGKLYDSLDDLTAAENKTDKKKERRKMLVKEYDALDKEMEEVLKKADEISKQLAEIRDEIDEIDGVKPSITAKELYNLFFN